MKLTVGIGATLALILFATPVQLCMDGRGHGFPFAWYHPGHGERGAIAIHPEEKFSPVIDVSNLVLSLALWGVVVGAVGAASWYPRRGKSS